MAAFSATIRLVFRERVTEPTVAGVKQLATAALARLGKPGSHADIATRLHAALTTRLEAGDLHATVEIVNDDIWVASRDLAARPQDG